MDDNAFVAKFGEIHPVWNGFFLMEWQVYEFFVYLPTTFFVIKIVLNTFFHNVPIKVFRFLFDGFLLGMYTHQIIALLVVTRLFTNTIKYPFPEVKPSTLSQWFTTYGAYILLWTTLMETFDKLFSYLANEKQILPEPFQVIKAFNQPFHMYVGFRMCPGGLMSIFYGIHFISKWYLYYYKVLKRGGIDVSQTNVRENLLTVRLLEALFVIVLCAVAQLFTFLQPFEAALNIFISFNAVNLVLLIRKLYKLKSHKKLMNGVTVKVKL